MYNVGCNTCNRQGVCLLCGIKFRAKQAGAISVVGNTTVRYYNVVQLQCTMYKHCTIKQMCRLLGNDASGRWDKLVGINYQL